MRTSSTSEASHVAATRLAARGADVQQMQATVDLARQMLAARQSEPLQTDAARTGSVEPDGSAAETPQPPPKHKVFLATVSELVQGQGHTLISRRAWPAAKATSVVSLRVTGVRYWRRVPISNAGSARFRSPT